MSEDGSYHSQSHGPAPEETTSGMPEQASSPEPHGVSFGEEEDSFIAHDPADEQDATLDAALEHPETVMSDGVDDTGGTASWGNGGGGSPQDSGHGVSRAEFETLSQELVALRELREHDRSEVLDRFNQMERWCSTMLDQVQSLMSPSRDHAVMIPAKPRNVLLDVRAAGERMPTSFSYQASSATWSSPEPARQRPSSAPPRRLVNTHKPPPMPRRPASASRALGPIAPYTYLPRQESERTMMAGGRGSRPGSRSGSRPSSPAPTAGTRADANGSMWWHRQLIRELVSQGHAAETVTRAVQEVVNKSEQSQYLLTDAEKAQYAELRDGITKQKAAMEKEQVEKEREARKAMLKAKPPRDRQARILQFVQRQEAAFQGKRQRLKDAEAEAKKMEGVQRDLVKAALARKLNEVKAALRK
mmetsp:Transcript_111118/g.254805  ORF Transcript_111118/g.254805 Transcript_111118/m.254805 type:complete len:417 (+) Transcript_111118:64-1314(+)